jgi:hypothetical protein
LKKKTVLIDIDDTLIDTNVRRHAIWRESIGLKVTLPEVESLNSKEILEKHLGNRKDLWIKFWRTLLCTEKSGEKYLELDQPMPHAVNVVCEWSKEVRIAYITGRTENMRKLTINELRKFGFPVDDDGLYMSNKLENFLESTMEMRRQLVHLAAAKRSISCVVDDYPRYFPVYATSKIPLRIGLLRAKRYKPSDYKGASFVFKSWLELDSFSFK